ncbi:hypothetical protein DPMN_035081 [Dreissena polymorpha]|uniref:Uncharacterized protein n=1 Tax=Dreissena polymorpha TaxID=45954 RepID=A0A9D4M906_DREPO|nr:hypothetical protein DPMN_035081 [Dreissena polymorpha]
MSKKSSSTSAMAKTPMVASQESSKGAATSPFDQVDFKKKRQFLTKSLCDASVQISLSDSDIATIADVKSKLFEPQFTFIVK